MWYRAVILFSTGTVCTAASTASRVPSSPSVPSLRPTAFAVLDVGFTCMTYVCTIHPGTRMPQDTSGASATPRVTSWVYDCLLGPRAAVTWFLIAQPVTAVSWLWLVYVRNGAIVGCDGFRVPSL